MGRSRLTVRIGVVLGAAALVLGACGGGDSNALSDEEFCAELEALEEADANGEGSDELDAEALAQLRDLADRAPNEDIEAALTTLGDIAEDMEGFDEDDPDAFGEVMALMFDPEVISAGETLDTYLTETCGFEDVDSGMGASDPFGEEGGGDDGSDAGADDGADAEQADGVSTFDALDSSVLNDGFARVLEDLDVESDGRSVSVSGGSEVTVVFDAGGVADADPIDVCEGVSALVDDALSDVDDPDPVTVEVAADGDVVASRADGGDCTAA